MRFVLENLFGLIYLLAIVGGVGWWLWVVRRSRQPAKPQQTAMDKAEIARLRAHIEQAEGESGGNRFPR